jgi:hypothetical protein
MRVPLWPVHNYATAITFRDRHVLATRKQETTEAGTSLPMDALRTRTNVEFDAALRFWFRSVVLDKRHVYPVSGLANEPGCTSFAS